MDTIFNVAFGMDIECQTNPENIYFTKAKQFFDVYAESNLLLSLLSKLIELIFYSQKS